MIDSYLWGNVSRISPEAPVPIVSCTKTEKRLGGAANVALNLKSLGASPILCSVIGKDEYQESFVQLMRENNMIGDGILDSGERQTTIKTRIIGLHQQLLRVDHEMTEELSPGLEKFFIDHVLATIKKHQINAIIFQDYDKGCITPAIIGEVVDYANKSGIPVLVDPKKRNFLAYNNVSVFKPNYKEFTEGLNAMVGKTDSRKLFEVAKKFLEEKNINQLLLTLSEAGVFVCDKDQYFQIPTHARDVVDVSGAGDTVISVAALCKASGFDMKEMAAISNLAGGLVCEKLGVVPVEKQWLESSLSKI